MKNKIFALSCITAVVFIALSIQGCKKKSTVQKLQLHLHANVDTNEVDLGTTYANAAGRNISLSSIRYYISNVKMIDQTGAIVSIPGTILVSPPTEEYELGEIPVGTYKSITFDVGVAAADNHSDPASKSSTDPLHTQSPSMNFGTTDGYVFADLEGMVDTSSAGTSAPNAAFSYKIGTDALRKTVTMPVHSSLYTVTANNNITVHIIADFSVMLRGLDMKTIRTVTPQSDLHDATLISNNISSMFTYEQ
jgi:hypothetical protein